MLLQATTSEIQYMAKVGKELGESDYTKSAKRGIQFLLDAQYPEKLDGKTLKGAGGWPQYYGGDDLCKGDCYPDQSGSTSYYRDVTFNDNAHITVMCAACISNDALSPPIYPPVCEQESP